MAPPSNSNKQSSDPGLLIWPELQAKTSQAYRIVKHFDFAPDLLRGEMIYVTKGSPEGSCVGNGVEEVHRALGQAKTATREELEAGRVLGRVSMTYSDWYIDSKLKADTRATITSRRREHSRKMITGDHIQTAIAVARDVGILGQSTALVGGCSILCPAKFWNPVAHAIERSLSSPSAGDGTQVVGRTASRPVKIEELNLFLCPEGRGAVHGSDPTDTGTGGMSVQLAVTGRARGRAEHSPSLVGHVGSSALWCLSPVGHARGKTAMLPPVLVLFCGDGANDMPALRAAAVGVSLCDAETSVAAPITSKLQTPGAVVDVLREGRWSLVTAYVLVNFNIMYGVIQLYMTCQLYSFGLKAGNYMYLIQDLFYTLFLGVAIPLRPPRPPSAAPPPTALLHPPSVVKLFSQLICFPAFQSILCAPRRTAMVLTYRAGDERSPTHSRTSLHVVVYRFGSTDDRLVAPQSTSRFENLGTPTDITCSPSSSKRLS
eukprot:gene757-841_t